MTWPGRHAPTCRARRKGAGCRYARGSGRKPGQLVSASHPEQRAAYRAIYLGNDPAAYGELSLSLARLEMTAADWAAIRAPTLVASGAHDFLWPPEIGRQVADLIPGAKFVIMEDAGPFPHLQAPGPLVRLAGEFFL